MAPSVSMFSGPWFGRTMDLRTKRRWHDPGIGQFISKVDVVISTGFIPVSLLVTEILGWFCEKAASDLDGIFVRSTSKRIGGKLWYEQLLPQPY